MQGSAVSQFIDRYRHGVEWDYDHHLEERALERGWGIIVWQEQVVQLVMDVGGMSAAQADEVRRAFARPNNEHLIAMHWQRFLRAQRKNKVFRRDRKEDIQQGEWPLHVPGVALARILHNRVPGGVAQALPSD